MSNFFYNSKIFHFILLLTVLVTSVYALPSKASAQLGGGIVPPPIPTPQPWREMISSGDILYDKDAIFSAALGDFNIGHVGIFARNMNFNGQMLHERVIEAQGEIRNLGGQVNVNPITDWDYPSRDNVYILRVNTDVSTNHQAIAFAKNQINKPYDWNWFKKSSDPNSPSWYCSELVWAAYLNNGVDLEHHWFNETFPETIYISPAEIDADENTQVISSHSINTNTFKGVAFIVASPVDIIVTAPDGTILGPSDEIPVNQLPGEGTVLPEAGYVKAVSGSDGKKGDVIIFPEDLPGDYQVKVIPEAGAAPEDTYTLEASTGPNPEDSILLAQDKPVPASDESHSYTVDPAGSGGFSDTETLEGNTYQAGTLDVSIPNSETFSPKLSATQPTAKTFTIKNSGSLDAHYIIETDNATGSCQTLQIKDNQDNNYQALSSYESSTSTLNANTQKYWTFTVKDTSSEADFPYGKQCNFDLKITAWQQNLANATSGFSDTETIGNTVERIAGVQPGDVVINEVYYDVDSAHGSEGYNEWVELYNQTSDAVNLAGWELCDNSGCDELPSATIGKEGFVVVTGSSTTWGMWPSIPAAAEKITVGGYLGYGLSNSGDYLTLKDDSGQEIDFTAWEQGAGTDWDITANEGESMARDPKGFDENNTAADFKILTDPDPGKNPSHENFPNVVINEFLPNASSYPEYIEVYNKGNKNQDISGWELTLKNATTHNLVIDSSLIYGGGNTEVGPKDSGSEWKAIDLSKKEEDLLDDNSGTIKLYDDEGMVLDSINYPLHGKPSQPVEVDKSIARIPDGTGGWVDPYPTPGGANRLEETREEKSIKDTYAPNTSIDSHPAEYSTSSQARFTFSCNESSCAFECRLNQGKWESCTSPKTYQDLWDGSYVFYVQATDGAGNTDPLPASFSWNVDHVTSEEFMPSDIQLQNSTSSALNLENSSTTKLHLKNSTSSPL